MRALHLLSLTLALAACGADPGGPGTGGIHHDQALTLEVFTGTASRSDTVLSSLPDSVVVRVLIDGVPVPAGREIHFLNERQDGSYTDPEVTATDSLGITWSRWIIAGASGTEEQLDVITACTYGPQGVPWNEGYICQVAQLIYVVP